jgi:CubicO group peptidase (beta-lactamase class C family)
MGDRDEEERVRSMSWIAVVAVTCAVGVAVGAAGDNWPHATPEEHGVDSAKLETMRQTIDVLDLPIDSVVVVRHGGIVFEYYPNPSLYGPNGLHNLYSVTKSVTSILIGIAIDEGSIEGVDQSVVGFFPDRGIANLDACKERMTLEHLLTMTSGLEWQGPDDMYHSWGKGIQSGDPVQYALDRPMVHEPGTVWHYNGGCSHLLSAILTKTTGMSTLEFAREHLFGPLGITSVRWPRDPHGIYYGGQDIWLTPYDMAKLGQLLLDGGVWNGEQIVPAEWIKATTTQSVELPWSGGYGYQWWLYPEDGIYYASGAFDQHIYVIPDLDMVVVFTASNWPPGILPGERTGGAPVVDWLLGSFVLPACDAYTRVEYDGFGFSLATPRVVDGEADGWGGAGWASEASGVVSFSFGGSPFEAAGVQWATAGGPSNLESVLDAFLVALERSVDRIEPAGPPTEAGMGAHSVLCQRFDAVTDDGSVSAVAAALYCEEKSRAFVIYHAVHARLTDWLDPIDELTRLVESFECHE